MPDFKYSHLKIMTYVYCLNPKTRVCSENATDRFLKMYSYLIWASRVRNQYNYSQKYLK